MITGMPIDVEDFLRAQAHTFEDAMAELRAGAKRTHWMWFVFPVLAGVSRSTTAVRFALPDVDAAAEYLRHPDLRARLVEAVKTVHDKVCVEAADVVTLMGGTVDAQKLVSCLSLFRSVARAAAAGADDLDDLAGLASHAHEIVEEAVRQGVPLCDVTEQALGALT